MRERSRRLQEQIHGMLDAGVRRTLFFDLVAKSLARTEGEPRQVRRAKGLAHLLDNVEQVVLPHELVAGSIAGLWPLARDVPPCDERLREARQVVRDSLDRAEAAGPSTANPRWALMARDHYDASIPYPDLQRVARQVSEELAGEGAAYADVFGILERHFVFDYGRARRLVEELPWFASNHLYLNYKKALRHGLGGLRRQIVRRREQTDDAEKRTFYDSTLIVAEAAIRFIRRYSQRLLAEARRADPARAAELTEMAGVCERIAERRPGSFQEALQLVWLLHVIAHLGGGAALSFARFDQYMLPYLEHDLEHGRITRDAAKELVECIWLKVNEPKMRTVQSICLSGLDREGRDATNELTRICLEVAAEAGEPYPNTAVRMHAGSPPELWAGALAGIMAGNGQPQIFNDDAMIPGLVEVGYPLEDARDYYPMGCVEVMIEGVQPTYQGAGTVVLPDLLGPVLDSAAGGAREPPSLGTFREFLDAYLARLRNGVRRLLAEGEERALRNREIQCDPFASLLVDDSLETGVDVCRGGARYPLSFTINAQGLGTAADSLAAIKTFVYDRGRLTLAELKQLLDRDFEGAEPIRRMLAGGTPAYGNDLAEVDGIAEEVFDAYVEAVRSYESPIGGLHSPQMFSYTSHVRHGELTPATPNGRRAGATYSDGIGPTQGRDVGGPTCLISSVTRLDHSKLAGGCAFNLKLSPGVVAGDEGVEVLRDLLRAYLEKGGLQIQVNLVGQETLREAQAHPEDYGHVIVRVAGYCEYFTNLDRVLQDEIIARTSQQTAGA